MTIAFVAQRAAATSAAAGTSWAGLVMAAGASISPGNTLILSLAYRDAATPPTDARPQPGPNGTTSELAFDQRGNLWRRVAVSVNQGSTTAADTGAVSAIWVCHVTFPYLNGDIILLNAPISAVPLTHISGQIAEFSGVLRFDRALDLDTATGNTAASSVTGIAPNAADQLVYGCVAVASNPTLTGDADVTDGVWSAIDQATSGGGGIRRGDQYKIVTGTTAQSWDVTWTGTQQWAGCAVVMQEARVAWPYNNRRLENPNFPCPAGPEIIPVEPLQTPVDTGTSYVFNVTPQPESSGSSSTYWAAYLATLDPAVDMQHTVVAEVYPTGQEQVYSEPTVLNFGVPYAAVLQGGATTTSGTAVAALSQVGGAQVVLETTQSVDCYWDFTDLIPLNGLYRVLEVRINYLAWKDDSAAPQPGEGLGVYWRDELAVNSGASSRVTSLYGAWLVNDYRNAAKRVYKTLGEINGVPQIGATSRVQYANLGSCFTISDLIRMNSGTAETMLSIFGLNGSAPSQETVFLDTIELQVVVVPEKRLGQSARRVCSGVGFASGLQAIQGSVTIPMYSATSSLTFWQSPANGDEVAVVLRESLPASPSDWFSAQTDPTVAAANFNGQNIRYASQERVGPSVAVSSIIQPRETISPVPDVTRVAWSNGQIAPNSTPEPYNHLLYTFTLFGANSYQTWWPAPRVPNVLDSGIHTTNTVTMLVATDGASVYDYIRLILKAPDTPSAPDLTISIQQPALTVLATATVTQAQVLALPDIGNGYCEVHVPLSGTITPSGATAVNIVMSSTTLATDPWIPALAADNAGRTGYTPFPQVLPTGLDDLAVVLCCTLSPLSVSVTSSDIELDNTGNPPCVIAGSTIPCVTISNASDYDWLTIERIVGGTDVLPVALLDVNDELSYPALTVYDDFSRTVVGSWGSPNVGTPWVAGTLIGGNSLSVSAGRGVVTTTTTSSTPNSVERAAPALTLQTVRVSVPATPTGNAQLTTLYANDGVDDEYAVRASFNTNGTLSIVFRRIVGGGTSIRDSFDFPDLPTGGSVWLKMEVNDTVARYKAWRSTTSEPGWLYTEARPAQTPFTTAGLAFARLLANTSPNVDMYADDYSLYNVADQALAWCDYGVPWDLQANTVEYRVQGFRDSDHRTTATVTTPWADTSPNAGAAFGIATEDGLYAYVPGAESGQLELTWNRIYPVEMLPLAGKDYQVALRPSEVRGYSISTVVMVDKLAKCVTSDDPGADDGTYDGLGIYDDDNFYDFPATSPTTESPGAKSMAPTPFAQLNQLERTNAVTLKLPGGHTRRVYLDTGAQVIVPVIGKFMAEITLTDVPPVSIVVPEYPETL